MIPRNSAPPDAKSGREAAVLPLPSGGGRRRWFLPLGLSVVFLSGAAVGGGVMTVVTESHNRDVLQHPDRMVARILPVLQKHLALSDEQSEQVHGILIRHHERLEVIREEVGPRFKAELRQMDDEIAGVLDGS